MSGAAGEPQQPEDRPQGAGGAFVTGTVSAGSVSGGAAKGVETRDIHVAGDLYIDGKAVVQDRTPPSAPVGKRWFRVPQRNPIFTGRENELRRLHESLRAGNAALTPIPQALQGLGGVGKSQTAIEYIWRHGGEYSAVFWVIGETPEQLAAELANLAPQLDPSVPPTAPQDAQLHAAQRWFATHPDWLLVVDNAAQLPKLKPLLPLHPSGRILLTTRESVSSNFARRIEIQHLDDETGALLLLRRAEILEPEQALNAADSAAQTEAQAVSAALGGLALALDQAGAYMQQRKISPAAYRNHYEQRRQQLHPAHETGDHPTVAVTFSLALEQVEQIARFGPAAAELARMCAFLAPEPIPDAIFREGAHHLNEPLAAFAANEIDYLDVCEAACRYALLRREANPSGLWMHRLAQEVLRDSLNAEQQRDRAERVVRAVNAAFPDADYTNWSFCAALLPHALHGEQHIETYAFILPEAGRLLNQAAWYLRQRARYAEAERCYSKALPLHRQAQGEEHADVAAALNNLAVLYLQTGRPDEAVPLLEEAIAISRKTVGEQHSKYAIHLDQLAQAYMLLGRTEDAEPLRRQALAITEQALGSEHPDVAVRCNNLATLYSVMGRYDDAIPLYERALAIDRATIGKTHPDYAIDLYNLAGVYVQQGRPDAALPLLAEARAVLKQADMAEHPYMADCLNWLGHACYAKGQQAEARDFFRQALAIYERVFAPEHLNVVTIRANLAFLDG